MRKPLYLLIGGPAGVGKTTLAERWCGSRDHAVHIQLDEIRDLILDPTRYAKYWLSAVSVLEGHRHGRPGGDPTGQTEAQSLRGLHEFLMKTQ